MSFKPFLKTFFISIFLLLVTEVYAVNSINIGLKYGYAYFDDESLDKGKTYAGLLSLPLSSSFDIQLEYGKFEDDDKIIDDGKYFGGYIGYNFNGLPFKVKAGFVKEEIEFEDIQNIEFEDIEENNFSFGVSVAVRTPIISGFIEYLQISDEVYTIAAIISF